jgi:hypothetical protein
MCITNKNNEKACARVIENQQQTLHQPQSIHLPSSPKTEMAILIIIMAFVISGWMGLLPQPCLIRAAVITHTHPRPGG